MPMPRAAPCLYTPPLLALCTLLFTTVTHARDVSALGRLEPLGGMIRIGVPSSMHAVSGSVIRELRVAEGDRVETGQVLAITDSTAMLRDHLAMTRSELALARVAAEAGHSRAEEACTLADVAAGEARRRSSLRLRELASAEETEQAEGEARARAASCTAARAEARVAEAEIGVVEARVALRESELERSLVRAPFNGQVLEIHAHPGELASLEGVLDLGRTDRMAAIAEVYETDIGRVRPGQPATVTSAALGEPLRGRVARIKPKVKKQDVIGTDPAARKDARIVEVEITLEDSGPAAALTNLQVEIVIETGA